MTKTYSLSIKSSTCSAVVLGLLLSLMIPAFASAQAPAEAGASNRGNAPAATETRGAAPRLEDLRSQVAVLQERIKSLQATRGEQGVEGGVERSNRPGLENGLRTLPEQASDRARQVMQCLQLGRSLGLGARGTDVQEIQEFLKEEGFFTFPTATGYFGTVTQEAIKAFQASRSIVTEGSPETTGFGRVGPRTQAALAQASCLREGQAPDAVVDDEDEEKDEGVEVEPEDEGAEVEPEEEGEDDGETDEEETESEEGEETDEV